MILSHIVAHDRNFAIGSNNKLPWHLPEDLKRFKALTQGKVVIMGRKTFESIGKPLPLRINIIVTRGSVNLTGPYDKSYVIVVPSIEEAIAEARRICEPEGQWTEKSRQPESEVFIIGGGEIYSQTINTVNRIYVTLVETVAPEPDAFYPKINVDHWKIMSYDEGRNEKFNLNFKFYILKNGN
jgi:dihydrofolate reductase